MRAAVACVHSAWLLRLEERLWGRFQSTTARCPNSHTARCPNSERNVHAGTPAGASSSSAGPVAAPITPTPLAEAQAELVKAQAKAALRRAEAAAHKAEAEAAAARERASADTKRAETDAKRADADAKRADAEAAAAREQNLRQRAHFLALAVLAGGLAVDWYTHESPDYIKRRVAARLRECRVPETAKLSPKTFLPVVQPLALGFRPTMLVGPTGSGKSTLLSVTAREAASSKKNTVFVRVRGPPSQGGPVTSAEEACARLDATAAQVFKQIGFPARRAVLQLALDRAAVTWGSYTVEMKTARVRDQLATALRLLFDVAEALCHERVDAGLSREDAAPVLLFDEVQDLIRDDRLACAGGRFLFQELATLLVAYGVDRRVVHSAVAGSSALLSIEFNKTVAAGARWMYTELQDPDPDSVSAALCARGYSAAEASAMIALCGTRLRLLEEPLTRGAAALSSQKFMDGSREMATRQFSDLLRLATTADARLIAGALDAALEFEAGKRNEPPGLDRSFTERHAELASKVMYLRLDGSLAFQSRLHADAWQHSRARFVRLMAD